MSLISTIFGGRKSADADDRSLKRDPSDDFWYSRKVGVRSAAGAQVTIESALTLPVVIDCLKVLQDTIASLPLHLYERAEDGSATKAMRHPLYERLSTLPNDRMTAFEFWGKVVHDLGTRGNHFSEILPGPRGAIDQLVPLNADTISISVLSDGALRYEIREPGRQIRYLLEGEIWHLKNSPLTADGLLGTSPIWYGREAIGSALALQDYAARFFANDATPPFVIQHPGSFKDEASKINFLAAIKKWWGGKNKGSPGILEFGMKVEKVGVNNEEAQFLETRNALNLDITRIWRVPPHKVGILDRATFTNIEHQSLEFVTDTILPIVRLIEQAISRDLILAPQRYYAQFNLDGLLRGDLQSRYSAYAIGRNWGWLSTNDIRRRENMNPVEGGDDDYLQPLNMVPAGEEIPVDARRKPEDPQALISPAAGVTATSIKGALHGPAV
jgi:HK97 family phage portal protein